MQSKLSLACMGVQGSGWGWLAYNKEANRVQIATTANQDPLNATTGLPGQIERITAVGQP